MKNVERKKKKKKKKKKNKNWSPNLKISNTKFSNRDPHCKVLWSLEKLCSRQFSLLQQKQTKKKH